MGTMPPILEAVKLETEELSKLDVQSLVTDHASIEGYFRSFRSLVLQVAFRSANEVENCHFANLLKTCYYCFRKRGQLYVRTSNQIQDMLLGGKCLWQIKILPKKDSF